MHAVFVAAIRGLFGPRRLEPPAVTLEGFSWIQSHLLRTGTSFVALDGDSLLGYGSAWQRGDDWFLASLFVAPHAQGRGIGAALLDTFANDPRRLGARIGLEEIAPQRADREMQIDPVGERS